MVLAGGTGTRLGLGIPKQLLKIAGKPIIEHTLAVFEARAGDRRDHRADGRRATSTRRRADRRARPASRRSPRSSRAARPATTTTRHRAGRARRRSDVQRPLPRRGTPAARAAGSSRECVNALWTLRRPSTWPSRPPTRSSRSDEDDCITDIPDRSRLRRGQTPQASGSRHHPRGVPAGRRRPRLRSATDDCGVVLRYLPDVPIYVVAGLRREHEGHPPGRRVHRRQALPARRRAGAPADRPPQLHRGADRPDHRGLRRQLRHRRRARRAGPALRRPGLPVQPLHHRHPRGAAPRTSRPR